MTEEKTIGLDLTEFKLQMCSVPVRQIGGVGENVAPYSGEVSMPIETSDGAEAGNITFTANGFVQIVLPNGETWLVSGAHIAMAIMQGSVSKEPVNEAQDD